MLGLPSIPLGDVAIKAMRPRRFAFSSSVSSAPTTGSGSIVGDCIDDALSFPIPKKLPSNIPLLKSLARDSAKVPWDHKERPFIMWIHIIASTYGWSLTEIRSLWPEEAAIYVQEILLDEQLDREWDHMLSPVAHSADKSGKDVYKRLQRPSWMAPRPRKQKLLRKTLPQGHIINISGIKEVDLDD